MIRAILIRNTSTSGSSILLVGGAAANALPIFTSPSDDKLEVRGGGIFLLTSPLDGALSIGTNGVLKLENIQGPALDYEIIVIGTNA